MLQVADEGTPTDYIKETKTTQQLQRFIATPWGNIKQFGGPLTCWWVLNISIDLVTSKQTILGPTGSCLDSTNSIKCPDPIYFASLWGGWVLRFPHLDCLVGSSSKLGFPSSMGVEMCPMCFEKLLPRLLWRRLPTSETQTHPWHMWWPLTLALGKLIQPVKRRFWLCKSKWKRLLRHYPRHTRPRNEFLRVRVQIWAAVPHFV